MVGYDNQDPKSIEASGDNVFREQAVIFSTLGFQDWAKRDPFVEALIVKIINEKELYSLPEQVLLIFLSLRLYYKSNWAATLI